MEIENTRNQHSANSRCRALSQAATTPWAASGEALGFLHFHFKIATESKADPKNGTLQLPLHLQATHLNQQDLPAGRAPCSTPSHTPESQCTSPARQDPGFEELVALTLAVWQPILAFLGGSGTGSAKRPWEAGTSRAGFVWPRLTSNLRPLKQ